jgi:multicomponent Na+:H+ antiporter subunit D
VHIQHNVQSHLPAPGDNPVQICISQASEAPGHILGDKQGPVKRNPYVVKTNLFLVSGVVYQLRGSYQLKKLGGVYRFYPMLGVLFLIPAFSLAGVPPLSGFWAKFALIRSGLETESYIVVAAALAVSLLTLFSMTKIWAEVFWKADPSPEPAENQPLTSLPYLIIPVVSLALITIVIGLFAEPFFVLATQAAEQLLNPAEYIQAVNPVVEG